MRQELERSVGQREPGAGGHRHGDRLRDFSRAWHRHTAVWRIRRVGTRRLAGGVLSLMGALTYGELGAMRPEAGGLYVYIRDAFGPRRSGYSGR
jgi:hypothetical protein